MPTPHLRIGIDIGGTFTDFVVYHPETGAIETFKLLSTPHNPAEAVLQGLERIRRPWGAADAPPQIIHGSTVATNALLERKGARAALVTTWGFRDVLQIGRQTRPELYDLFADPPEPLIPAGRRFEVDERVDSQGQPLRPLDPAEVDGLIPHLHAQGVSAVAVCLLFSFLHPDHERILGERLAAAGFEVSLSSEILPEYREYERTSTTAVNAYVSPVLAGYLTHLETGLAASGPGTALRVMQSNGGNISLDEARRYGVRCILSGPAGGVVGARYVAALAAGPDAPRVGVITFDMGGTSTDVALIDEQPQVTTEAIVGGCPIRIPILDIHTIGAGGGSIARVDAGGALRVGPESAGADPGPACYGRGELPTVTDANLVLGRLAGEHFLDGQMPLDAGRARQALERLAAQMGLDPLQAARGVVDVANAHMERALRVISVERGHDPRRFSLLSFGGAGGLHASGLARRLGIPRVLVPPLASTLSAFGMLAADVVKDYTQTVMLTVDPGTGEPVLAEAGQRLAPLLERGRCEVQAEGIPAESIRLEPSLDVRYRGQSYELSVPFGPGALDEFHARHRQAYGYARPEAPLEIVNLRVRATGQVEPPGLTPQPLAGPDPTAALLEHRPLVVGASAAPQPAPFYRGELLRPGNRLAGPAVVVRSDTTILLEPGDQAEVDGYGNLWIKVVY